MAHGRTVVKVTSYSNVPFNHMVTDVVYNDGTGEQFGPTVNYTPGIGDVEDITSYGTRAGWFCANGQYMADFGAHLGGGGNLGLPPYLPSVPTVFLPTVTSTVPYEPEPTATDILEAWDKIFKTYLLIEVEGTEIKGVYPFADSFKHYVKYRNLYGKDRIKLTNLDSESAKILYGKNEKV